MSASKRSLYNITFSTQGTTILTNSEITNSTISTLRNTNQISTNISGGTVSATTFTGGSLSLSGNLNVAGTLTTVNITSTNLVNTNVSGGVVVASTLLSATGNSNTIGNIFTTGGNVGIGTTSPSGKLTVLDNNNGGGISIEGIINPGLKISTTNGNLSTITQKSASDDRALQFYNLSGGAQSNDIIFKFLNNTTAPVLNILNNGNVGIGTASPGAKLDVNGTTLNRGGNAVAAFSENQQLFSWSGSTTGTYMHSIKTRHNAGANDIHNAFDFYVWQTSDAVTSVGTKHVMSATSIGVGINTTSPSYTLDVNGTLEASNSNGLMLFASSGNIGIGTTSPNGLLHLNNAALFTSSGNLTCTGDIISFGSLSDRRLKKDIEPISLDKAIDVVSRLRSVTFKWREDIFNESKRNTNDIGFIAQEIEDLIPEAVSEYKDITSEELYKNIKYEKIIPYLTKALQETLEELKITKSELLNAKDNITDLQHRIAQLENNHI